MSYKNDKEIANLRNYNRFMGFVVNFVIGGVAGFLVFMRNYPHHEIDDPVIMGLVTLSAAFVSGFLGGKFWRSILNIGRSFW